MQTRDDGRAVTALQDIRASRASRRSQIDSHIKSMIAARRAPRHSEYAMLLTQDSVGYALENLEPAGLPKIISHSLQSLLPYRLARFFEAAEINAGLISIADLRRLKTPESRRALAALGVLGWRSANVEERRIILTCNLLRRIAAGGVTI